MRYRLNYSLSCIIIVVIIVIMSLRMSIHYDSLLYVCDSFIPRHSSLLYTVHRTGTTNYPGCHSSLGFSFISVLLPTCWLAFPLIPVYFEPLRILAFTKGFPPGCYFFYSLGRPIMRNTKLFGFPHGCSFFINEHDLRKIFIRHHSTKNFGELNSNLPH